MRNVFKKLILMGVAVTLAGIAEAKTFRYATTGDVLGLDPHANNEGGAKGMEVPDLGIYANKDWPAAQKGHSKRH